MLNKSNILALVGGGRLPKFSTNKITLWDDHQGMIISQLRFNNEVKGVKLRKDYLIAIFEENIYIFDINTLQTIDIIDTNKNLSAMVALSNKESNFCVGVPNKIKGKVEIKTYNPIKDSKIFNAHESNIAYISINADGTILATASDKGTIIRLFNIATEEMIAELRRGTKAVKITCLAFDLKSNFIACSSETGTIHIFDIEEIIRNIESNNEENKKGEEDQKNSKKSSKKIIKQRSFAKFRIQDNKSMVCYEKDNTIIVITSEGVYFKAAFDARKGGNCCKIEEHAICA